MDSFAPNAILKNNTLARLGHHFDYEFFKVKHVTKKGTVMGHYLSHSREYIDYDMSNRTDLWRVQDATVGKIRKLPHSWSWELVTPRELEAGVVATSCVR